MRVQLRFMLPAPKTWRSGLPTTRPDVENLAKGLLDSWNGVLYRDDSQVAELMLSKAYSIANPGVWVTVERMNGAAKEP